MVPVVGLLVAWFALSVVCQTNLPFVTRIRDRDWLTLVPSWRFFAPRPSIVDLHLLVRDRLADGSVTPFVEVPLPYQSDRAWWLWNPQRRVRKIVFDAVRVLDALAARLTVRDTIVTSVPYLLLLNFLLGLEHDPSTTATQFVVVRTNEFSQAEPRLVLRSPFHPVG